jgi:hypothetical protein
VFVEASPVWFDEFIEAAKIGNTHAAGLDHWQSYNETIAVFSPYKADGEALLPPLAACNNAGLIVRFSGRSSYDPRAFRVIIFRSQDVNDFHDFEEIAALERLENDELVSAHA